MKEITLSKKELQHRLNSIKINSKGLKPRKHGVSVKYFSGNEAKPYKRIDYEVVADLQIINGIGFIRFDKNNIFYNQHSPDLINEIISDSITKSIYPIETTINERGNSTCEILNHDEIINRWKQNKELLSEKYQSKALDEFFAVADRKINSKPQIERSLHHDWFWNLFFHPRLINYGDYRQVETDLLLSVIPYQAPVRFHGVQTIEKIPTDYHSFVIRFESNEIKAPKYFYPKSSADDFVLYMSLRVEFDSDLYHHFPMHTRAMFQVYSKNPDGSKLICKKIEFTMYQINSDGYQNKTLSVESPFITGGLVKLPPNKWGFDNFENLENNW
jgi:hypothetical protein